MKVYIESENRTVIGSPVEIIEDLRKKAFDPKDSLEEYLDWLQDHLRRFFKPDADFGTGSIEDRSLAAIKILASMESLQIEEEQTL
jgi:hypothetical protein